LLCAAGIGCLSGQVHDSLADQAEAASRNRDGQRLMQARCTLCHSADLVTQQRLDLPHWKATVTKMVHWGAQLSEDERQVLIDFLARQYSPEAPEDTGPAPRGSSGPALMRPMGNAPRGNVLYLGNCLPCHGPAATGGMGPKLAMMPVLEDEPRFWQTVLEGRGAMPAWGGTLADQEVADIYAWLRSLR
jgi:cytochrome c oxidase cbb3-type subunit 3